MPRRSTVRRLALAAAVAAGPLVLLAGCKSSDPAAAAPGPGDVERTDRKPIELKPSWRKYAEDNYRGVVLIQLNAASDVRFLERPVISAQRNTRTGDTELMVIGQVDANDSQGVRMRRPFVVIWRGAGSGWDLLTNRVDPGAAAPDPAPIPSPAPKKTSPTTGPATPADPSAPAPGGPPATPPLAPVTPP